MSRRVVLVGCVQRKLDVAAPARDLYVSPLFKKRRAYAERTGLPWAILSALHGVVEPERVLSPYDWRITDWRTSEIDGWGCRAVSGYHGVAWLAAGRDYELQRTALQGCVVEVHAGKRYVDAIAPWVKAAGGIVDTPLAGLGIGQQLAWYGTSAKQASEQAAELMRNAMRRAEEATTQADREFWMRVSSEWAEKAA